MTLLTVSKLSKSYDGKNVVNDVSFEFQSGKCIALIGPNGAGKTTILRTLAGLLKPSAGMIRFSGISESDDIRKYIGYLPQYPVFHTWMTGMEFMVYSGRLSYLSEAESKKRAETLLEKVGIIDAKNRRIGKYSGGMKQRLGIAQAIIHKPKLLILDEPVSSLDPFGRREVLTLMKELKEEMTILFSTHILSDAEEISDDLLLLNKGEIVEKGSIIDLRKKYQTSIIMLEFTEDVEKYQGKVNTLTSVRNSFIERDVLHVSVSDFSEAKQEILAIAVKENWPLTSFTLNRASLEDMFMKVVTN
ncbi:ABC transporter ATP-binding protein [Oceanobacillus chungangensis]|uniref:ABC transporter ATP-binding protein n=1 Tax=Oceanobacillus chungangensis TaxID=1229152 RepID=A0A3D8PNA1_9BACI|nr:ABC transporter ATP-binding protein [Oceanobacillus chungangensis]RDW17454.1 ABC transporter ATP-binding protein [Oceanobacillus chungangensis]